MDQFHAQIMEGELSRRLERHFPHVGHGQIAGLPERREPDVGELNYRALFALLDRLGHAGWVGREYRPALSGAGGTSAGLGWLRRI